MYVRDADGVTGGGAVAAALPAPAFARPGALALRQRLAHAADLELVVDLGARIGSREWWRGLATCTALCAVALLSAPRIAPLPGAAAPPLNPAEAREQRTGGIAPAAFGADTGARPAATALVEPLAETPERPSVSLTASLGTGDGFQRVLERNGVGTDQAREAAGLVAQAVSLGEIKPGTKLDLTLGRRPNKQVPRPLDHLAFRAKLELALAVDRVGGALRLKRTDIAVDETPLRIQGRVGQSLLAAARAAGAPARTVETWLRAMAQHVAVAAMRASDRFDLVIAHRRAATGETETGGLLLAGLEHNGKPLRLLKWQQDGKEQWFDAAGAGESRGQMKLPVAGGHVTSSFGMRFHPILGFSRMHQGIDYGAPMGTPIDAATDGVVNFAGWHGGHGNYVQIRHAGGLGTGYAHMSRILVHGGEHVRAGQLIGYVGSTGLSTGPHLHFEVFRNNVAVNPLSVKFVQAAQLAGGELQRFKATLARLLAVRVAD